MVAWGHGLASEKTDKINGFTGLRTICELSLED